MATEYEIIDEIDNICKNILNSSRNQLYIHMRYLNMAFDGLKYALSSETGRMGTDGFYLYYSPAFLMQIYREQPQWINRAYVHIIFHCIFKHPISLEDRDERIFNISADIATEYIIDNLDVRGLKKKVTGFRKTVYERIKENIKVPTAQSIYRFILEDSKLKTGLAELESEFCVDDHSFWSQYKNVPTPMPNNDNNEDDSDGDGDGEDGDGEGKGNGDGDSNTPSKSKEDFNEKWQQISHKTETDAETFSKSQSEETGGMTEYLRLENRERYDYKGFLKKFMVQREVMKLDLDSYDYIYYTYGLKVYGNMPLIESLEYSDEKRIEEFVIVIDTSASCESELVTKFLEETYSILKDSESFFRKINLHIIQCDSKVQSDKIIVCKEDFEQYMHKFEIKGRGGTDFSAAFDYVDNLIYEKKLNELKGLIYFTDGYGKYPSKMPLYEAAFVFVDDNYEDKGVPPWAIEIILGKDDIYEFGGNKT